MVDWKNKRIGLVLSGGGAKGAYQAGMFRALEQLGLAKNIKVISGCSIGAFNGAIYCAENPLEVFSFIEDFGKIYNSSKSIAAKRTDLCRSEGEDENAELKEFDKCETGRFEERLKRTLTDEKLRKMDRTVYVCCYSIEEERPKYFYLNNLEPDIQRKLILASGSIPHVFPSVYYKGEHYLDGGLKPDICKNGAPPDKIPLKPLLNEDVDAILVNFLIASDKVDRSGVKDGIEYLELRPSKPLEEYPGAGTLDFSPEKLRSHEELGYIDTLSLFKEE